MKRILAVFIKCAREQKRDLWVLLLTLFFAPLFVLLYWIITSAGGSTTFGLLVINQDAGPNGQVLVQRLQSFSYENGAPFLKVIEVDERSDAETRLRNRDAAALLIIPANFSQVTGKLKSGQVNGSTELEFVGDLTYPTYTVAAVSAMTVADNYLIELSGETRPVSIRETPLGASAARSEFENYVPGLFVMAVVLMVFQAAMMVARECEGGKLIRLRLAGIGAAELLGGISAWLVLVAAVSVTITFLAAVLLGFHSQGPLWLALLVTLIASISIIGIGLMVAAFSKTVTQAFVIANFPLGFLMFLTGAVFPLPRTTLFTWFGHAVAIYDILPPTHAVIALNKIFTLGGGWAEIRYEVFMLTLLTVIFFGVGILLFRKFQLQSVG
jgi:ABC-2 type transport system permease protein